MTRWATERLDHLADHWAAVVAIGFLWIAAEFAGAAALIITYR